MWSSLASSSAPKFSATIGASPSCHRPCREFGLARICQLVSDWRATGTVRLARGIYPASLIYTARDRHGVPQLRNFTLKASQVLSEEGTRGGMPTIVLKWLVQPLFGRWAAVLRDAISTRRLLNGVKLVANQDGLISVLARMEGSDAQLQ